MRIGLWFLWAIVWIIVIGMGVGMDGIREHASIPVFFMGALAVAFMEIARAVRPANASGGGLFKWWLLWLVMTILGYAMGMYGREYYRPSSPLAVFMLGGIFLTIVYYWGNIPKSANEMPAKVGSIPEEIAKLKKTVSQLAKDNVALKDAIQELRARLSRLEKKQLMPEDKTAALDVRELGLGTALASHGSQFTPNELEELLGKESSQELPVLQESKAALPVSPAPAAVSQDRAAASAALPAEAAQPAESVEKSKAISDSTKSETSEEFLSTLRQAVAAKDSGVATAITASKPEAQVAMPKPVTVSRALGSKASAASLETFVGEKLLSYVGIGILVLGLAFLLVYSLTKMGPAGRVATGVLLGGGLLAAGYWLERQVKLQFFGRIIMAGGWATLYFVAYGAYHVPEMKVITSPAAGTILLGIVAGSMIAHSLKYASEALTGVSLLLAYITLFITEVSVYTHVAALILAALVCLFTWRFAWLTTRALGVILLYGGYGIWLYNQPHKQLPQDHAEYLLVSVLLVSLWALLKAPDFAKPKNLALENVVMPMIDIFNLFGLAMVRKITHIVFNTSGSPASSLSLGILLIAIAEGLRLVKRYRLYRLDFTLGLILLLVGMWWGLGQQSYRMLAWMAAGTATFLYSFYRQDRYFRDLGNLTLLVATAMVLTGRHLQNGFIELCRLFAGKVPTINMEITRLLAGWIGILGAALIYGSGIASWVWLKSKGKWNKPGEEEREVLWNFLGTVTMMAALYKIMPPYQAVYAWMALAMVLFQYGTWRTTFHLHALSHAVLMWSISTGPIYELTTTQIGYTMALGSVLVYLNGFFTYRLSQKQQIGATENILERCLAVVATVVMMIGTSCLYTDFSATLTWLALGAFLFYYGIFRKEPFLRLLSHAVVLASICRGLLPIVAENDTPVALLGNWQASPSVLILLAAIVLYYLHATLLNFLAVPRADKEDRELVGFEEMCLVTIANLVLFVVLWYTVPPIAVAIAYSLFGTVFLECGRSWQRPYLQTHSIIALIASAFWLYTVNLGAGGYMGETSRRLLSSTIVIGLWAYAGSNWRQLLAKGAEIFWEQEKHFPTVLSYLGFIAITALIYHEKWAFQDGSGWAVYAIVLMYMPLLLAHSRYSLQSLIVMSMAALSVCGLATRTVGTPWEYLKMHPALVFLPLLIFLAHILAKLGRSQFEKVTRPIQGEGISLSILHYMRKIYAIMFCGIATFVLTAAIKSSTYAVAWGILALLTGWYGLTLREKFFRWTSLVLFGMAVCKIVFIDVFSFSTEEKIVTFISVGIALLLVSFLYNRLKDQLAKFLLED